MGDVNSTARVCCSLRGASGFALLAPEAFLRQYGEGWNEEDFGLVLVRSQESSLAKAKKAKGQERGICQSKSEAHRNS